MSVPATAGRVPYAWRVKLLGGGGVPAVRWGSSSPKTLRLGVRTLTAWRCRLHAPQAGLRHRVCVGVPGPPRLAARRAGQLRGAPGHRPPAAGPLRAAVPADRAVRAARGSSPPGRHRLPAVRREGGRQSGDQRTAALLPAASRAVEPARWRAGSAVPGAPVWASAARRAGRRWQ